MGRAGSNEERAGCREGEEGRVEESRVGLREVKKKCGEREVGSETKKNWIGKES